MVLLAAATALLAAPQACAATGNPATVTIVSPGNGGGAPGQTLQAGVFALNYNGPFARVVKSITISFSNPSLFSSATLSLVSPKALINGRVNPPTATATPPAASTTFSAGGHTLLAIIAPGQQAVFSLTVKLSPLSLNEQGKVAYAGMMVGPYRKRMGAPLWIAFAMLGLAMMTLPGWTRRRAWLLAAMVILLAAGAPGCGGDSSPSSTQTVTAVTEQPATPGSVVYSGTPTPPAGLPLKLGTITGQ